jgi:hypothetical protein
MVVMAKAKAPKRVTDVSREEFLKQLATRDLYEIIRMFDGQPDGSQIELSDDKSIFNRDEIGAELYRRGRIALTG